MTAAEPVSLNIEFHISLSDVALYGRTLGALEGHVPSGFVMRWIAQEPAISWLRAIAADRVPVHLQQSHEVIRSLEVEKDYRASLVCKFPKPDDVELEIVVRNLAGEVQLVTRSKLRLLDAKVDLQP